MNIDSLKRKRKKLIYDLKWCGLRGSEKVRFEDMLKDVESQLAAHTEEPT